MELTNKILFYLEDSGADICISSKILSKLLLNYSANDFTNYTRTSYHFWIKGKRPIPLKIVFKLINDNNLENINIESFSIRGGNKIKFPDEKNIKFCYILGLILGDGCLVHRIRPENRNTYLIKITFREKIEADQIALFVKDIFGIKSSIYKGRGCYDLCVYSKPLVLILNKKFEIPIGKKYGSICIPKLILNGDLNMKKAFLKGVFDSDGNIYSYKKGKSVQLRQKSGDFLSEIKKLFEDIDLIFNYPYYDKANNSWVLWTSKKELVDNFINKINDFKIEA